MTEQGSIEITFTKAEAEEDPQDKETNEKKSKFDLDSHFTLPHPSSNIRFQNKELHIFSQRTTQLIVEKDGDNFDARKTKTGSIGLTLLRGFYALMALLLTGFMFIFCLQIFLFLFIGLITESGATGTETEIFQGGPFIFTLLSIPVFVYGLANFMANSSAFTNDVWQGSVFFRSVANLKEGNVFFDWVTFILFVFVPFIVGCGTLYSKQDNWWEITASTWLICIFSYYLIFLILVIFYEVKGCLKLTSTRPELKGTDGHVKIYSLRNIIRAVVIRLKQRYSATKVQDTIHQDKDDDKDGIIDQTNTIQDTTFGLYSNIVTRLPIFFKKLEEPRYRRSFDQIREEAPIVTLQTWNLEKLFFLDGKREVIGITHGDSKLNKAQILSTFICAFIGSLIPVLIFGGLLAWFDMPSYVTAIVLVLLIIVTVQGFVKTANFYKLYKSDKGTKFSMYRERKIYVIAEPKPIFYWSMFVIEQALLFFVPMIGLFTTKNIEIASLFLVIGLITYVRYYLNAASSVLELGDLDEAPVDEANEYDLWLRRHRMSLILGKISKGRRRNIWVAVFFIFVFLFLSIALLAVAIGVSEGDQTILKKTSNFKYEENEFLSYPTCRMGAVNERPADSETALLDFTYLSSLAYLNPELVQGLLDEWFGENVAINQHETITNKFKTDYDEENGATAARYQLVDFSQNDVSIVSIRGTNNGWDAVADAQLWMAAMLVQYLRALIPLGEIWNPILRHIVTIVSIIESESIKNVAYYKETTAFTEFVRDQRNNTIVTGHSLGGGLALISGGQAKVPAIGISAPNNMLGRNSYQPKLTLDDITKYMFNIVPDRDPVPTFDDKGRLYQRIACTAATNNFVDCHFIDRTLCELMTKCGSHNRPVLCVCSQKYGYPEPKRIAGNMTFAEACAD